MRYLLDLGKAVCGDGMGLRADSGSPLGDGGFLVTGGPEGGVVALTLSEDDKAALRAAKFIAFDTYHELDYTMGVALRCEEGGTGAGQIKPHSLNTLLGVLPGLPTRLTYPLSALGAQSVFLPRTPGKLKTVVMGEPVDINLMDTLSIGFMAGMGTQSLWVSNLMLVDAEPEYMVPDTAVMDSFGQWTAKDWNGKVKDEEELRANLESYLGEAGNGAFPGDWSPYGGWKTLNFGGTGFFRTHHDGRRWWLVDPEGYAFFSAGIDCVRPQVDCRVAGIEGLMEWLPEKDGEYVDAWAREGNSFSYSIANAIRVWGADWHAKWMEMTAGQMRSWGFNTVANWSEDEIRHASRLPYVWEAGGFPTTGRRIFRDFPDVFSDEYAANAKVWAERLAPHKDDPFMIGYFLRNEPVWAFGENNIAEFLLADGIGLASMDRLMEWLRERYNGDIGALNAAWSSGFASWGDVPGTKRAASLSETASKDLWDFTVVLARQYLEPVCREARAADPNHLNLGIRWAWISSDACLAGSELFDVFSINMYQMEPDAEVIRKASEASGLPVMIGEYHWGALDVGLPSTGLRAVKDQAQRGVAYRRYLEAGAAMPWLVGAHYFQMNDQPVMGRFDGENFQIGLVDICFRPYAELVEAARVTHERIYAVANGDIAPVGEKPVELPRLGF